MNKNTRNWTIGIIIVIAVLILLWVVIGGTKNNAPETANEPNQNAMNHEDMNHDNAEASAPVENDNLSNYMTEQDRIMADMMQAMENIEESGNASIDFLTGMIPHHQSAIDMAESYLEYGGENTQLKQIANQIVESQTNEIAEMNNMIQVIQSDGQTDTEKEAAYLEKYNEMFDNHHTEHNSQMTPAQDVEEAFAQGMIAHHQMAVDMAVDILEYTDYDSVKTLAQNIIAAQEKEIQEMEEILQAME